MGNDALRDLVGQLRSRRINRRRFVQGTAALGASATAVSGALRAMPSARAATEVTMWTTFTAVDLDNVQAVVDGYNAQSSGAQVKLVGVPPAQVTDTSKLMTAVRGGTGPDIYLLDRFIVAQNAATGLLQDLSSLGADEVIKNYVPFAQQEASYNGKVWALPFDTDARALYYNKTLIKGVGVDPAEFDQSKGPLTWDRVAEVANMMNKQDSNGNYTQMGFVPWVNQGWHYTYGFSWGGKFFDYDKCQVSPDDPPIVDAFTWVQNYCKALGADKVNAFGNPSMQPGFDPAQHPFHLGQLGMQITGDWEIQQMAQYGPSVDYGITWMPVPKAGDPSVTWAGGWSVVIPTGAKNVNDAWTAMQWIGGEPGSKIYTTKSAHLSTVTALLSDASLFQGAHQFFANMLPTAKNRPPLPVGAKYWDTLTTAWQKTYLDQAAPADALKAVKDQVDQDLQQYCPIAAPPETAATPMAGATPTS